MNVENYYVQGRRSWLRLHEQGGKRHEMPCPHKLEEYLDAYLEECNVEGFKRWRLFRTAEGRSGRLSLNLLTRRDVYLMIRRLAANASIGSAVGCHSFCATGITNYLEGRNLGEGPAKWRQTSGPGLQSYIIVDLTRYRSTKLNGS
jgi:hypothetical protein